MCVHIQRLLEATKELTKMRIRMKIFVEPASDALDCLHTAQPIQNFARPRGRSDGTTEVDRETVAAGSE